MQKVAFLGLGVMGFPMAGHLARKGYEVTVYNRTASKAQEWVTKYGGRMAGTPAEAASGQDVVLCCVGNDDDLRQVITGDQGALAAMGDGAVLIDHTTASAEVAREIASLAQEVGVDFVDAPVSGGQSGAENGVLTVMCGGEQRVFDGVVEMLSSYARSVRLLGPVGSGQLTKMVNQICIAGVVQGLAEGVHFAQKAGLDVNAVLEVIEKGAAGSWQMENRGKTMVEGKFDFGFAVNWMRKDLAIALTEARQNGASLPVAALVDQFYSDVQKQGGGRWDTSSLLTRLK